MAETENLGMYVVPYDDRTANLIDWMQKLMGTADTSNMMILDRVITALQNGKANHVIESVEEPAGLAPGDEWDCLIEEVTT